MPPDMSTRARPLIPTGRPPWPGRPSVYTNTSYWSTSTNTVLSGRDRLTGYPYSRWTRAPILVASSAEVTPNRLSRRRARTAEEPVLPAIQAPAGATAASGSLATRIAGPLPAGRARACRSGAAPFDSMQNKPAPCRPGKVVHGEVHVPALRAAGGPAPRARHRGVRPDARRMVGGHRRDGPGGRADRLRAAAAARRGDHRPRQGRRDAAHRRTGRRDQGTLPWLHPGGVRRPGRGAEVGGDPPGGTRRQDRGAASGPGGGSR